MKTLNWEAKEKRARRMTMGELEYAIKDCMEAVDCGLPGSGYYQDEAGIYRKEIMRRTVSGLKKRRV